jgi:hypothetical protein
MLIPPDTPLTDAACASSPTTERCNALASELYRITTPYKAEGFRIALEEKCLTSRYPNIGTDIKQGSPIGNPPQLTHSFIPPNMKSALQHPQIVDEHIAEEVQAGRMSGPLTLNETHIIFKGHFRTSPLGLTEKEPGNGKFRLIRNLSKRDARRFSQLLSPVPRVRFPSFGFGTRSAFRIYSRVRFPSLGFGTHLAFLCSPRFLYISPRT